MKWVLKLGGSQYANARLEKIVRHATKFESPPVIVPGGGPFADQVRRAQKRWLFGDAPAHEMALLAMRQFGMLLAALGDVPVAEGDNPEPPCVWLPTTDVAYEPADWTFTSDSVAAHLAHTMNATKLVLLKPTRNAPLPELVDAQCMRLAKLHNLSVAVVDVDTWLATRTINDLKPCH